MRLRLVSKIVLFVLIISAMGVGEIAYFSFHNARELLHEQALRSLGDDVNKEGGVLIGELDKAQNDIMFLSESDAVKGIFRAIEGNGYDDLENSTTKIWKERLEKIFYTTMKQRPNYHQIRLIGIKDNGQEIVRMDMRGGKIIAVERENLQTKSHRTYFKETIQLKESEIYISDVNLNRERGEIEVPYVPVFQIATPIFSKNKELSGILVINVRFDFLVRSLRSGAPRNVIYFLARPDGEYLYHTNEGKSSRFELGKGEYLQDDFKGIDFTRDLGNKEYIDETHSVNLPDQSLGISFSHFHYDKLNPERRFIFGAAASYNVIDAKSSFFRDKLIILSIGILAIVIITLTLLMRYLLSPIGKLTLISNRIARGDREIEIPDFKEDEVGELAHAFKFMVEAKNNAFNELEQSKKVAENLVDGIITINSKGIILEFTQKATSIFQYQKNEVIGKNISMLMPNPYAREHDGYLASYYKTGEKKVIGKTRELRGLKKDGSEFPMELSVGQTMINDEPIFIGSVRDLTEKKKIERQLNNILVSAGEGIYGLDMAGNITFANPIACKMVGYREDEMVGNPHHALIHHSFPNGEPYPRDICNIYKALKMGKVTSEDQEVFWRKDGTSFPVQYTSTPTRDEKECINGAVVVFRDISKQKGTEIELRLAKEEAEQASIAKGEFLASMSHEIRTPMNGIIGTVSLIEGTNLDSKQKSYVQTIKSSGQSLLIILNEILDFSSLEAGEMEIRNEPFELYHCIDEVYHLFQAPVKEKGLEFNISYGKKEVPEFIIGDEGRIRQVVINLLNNAMKFTDKGSINLEVSLFKSENGDDYLKFSINDTGVGIPEDKHKELFSAFSQVDTSSVRKTGGTGLGLSISKELVKKMKGKIGVESTENKGSTFWFTCPLVVPSEEELMDFYRELKIKDESLVPSQYNASALIVEDVEVNLFVITDILEGYGCDVDHAENGKIAVDKVSKKDYDIIFMDCSMPIMDGFQATTEIRKTNKDIPIIALTANVLAEEKEKCYSSGMNDFVSKPVTKEVFIPILNKWIPDKALNNTALKEESSEYMAEGPIDLKFLDQFGKNAAKMVELTLKDADEFMENIDKAIEQKNSENLGMAAHSLKSILAQIGAVKSSEIAKSLELKGKGGKEDGVADLSLALKKEYALIKEFLLEHLEKLSD